MLFGGVPFYLSLLKPYMSLTKMLDNLERCDFIVSYAQFGNKSKQTLYRLADFYTLFYFRYVENNRSRDEQYWQHHFMDRSSCRRSRCR